MAIADHENISKVMSFLRRNITEEATDKWIDLLMEKVKLPRWIPGFVVRRVLDAMLPDKVLNSMEELLRSHVPPDLNG